MCLIYIYKIHFFFQASQWGLLLLESGQDWTFLLKKESLQGQLLVLKKFPQVDLPEDNGTKSFLTS